MDRTHLRIVVEQRVHLHRYVGRIRAHLKDLEEKKGITYKPLREALDLVAQVRHECILCHTRAQDYRHFMVTDELWDSVVGDRTVCMCLPCFEAALGREVTVDDLKRGKHRAHLPINYHLLEEPSNDGTLLQDPAARAKQVVENENHYKDMLDRLLTPKQKAAVEEAENNPVGTAHGIRSDAVASHNRRGFHQNRHRKRN